MWKKSKQETLKAPDGQTLECQVKNIGKKATIYSSSNLNLMFVNALSADKSAEHTRKHLEGLFKKFQSEFNKTSNPRGVAFFENADDLEHAHFYTDDDEIVTGVSIAAAQDSSHARNEAILLMSNVEANLKEVEQQFAADYPEAVSPVNG